MEFRPLTDASIDEVLERLGFSSRPSVDQAGLEAVYGAWCTRVPFDNLRKLVALHYGMPELPGIDPADFFAAWLLTGAGGTCWSSNNALHALLQGLGFEARLHAGAMWDGDVNHGTTIVVIDETEWLVDTAMLSGSPLRLAAGQPASVEHRGYVVSARPDPGGWLIDVPTPDPDFFLPCRLHGPIDHRSTVVANERSREFSPFNGGIMCHTNDADGVWMLKDGNLARFDETGTVTRALDDGEIDEFLVGQVGYAPQLVAEVRGVLGPES